MNHASESKCIKKPRNLAELCANAPRSQSLTRLLVAAVAIFVATPVLANADDAKSRKVFVPYEPYVASKREEYRLDMVLNSGCTEQAIEGMLNHAEQSGFLFSPHNVVSAFPTIYDSDQLNIGCVGQQVRMEFLSVMSTNTLLMKAVSCDVAHNGMACLPPVESERFFLVEPGKNFELSGNVSFEEAAEIIEWFRHDAGAYLSDSEKEKARNLAWRASIGEEDGVYTYRVGDPYCGCLLRFQLKSTGTRVLREQIAVVGNPTFECP